MEIVLIALLTIVAGMIGTITGFGTSMMMLPVLVMFFPAVEAIFLVAIIHWFGNVWKVTLFRSGLAWRLFFLFGLAGIATSYLGAFISLGANEEILLRLLGIFLSIYSLFLIFKPKFKIPAGNITALSGGALSGFFLGIFGMGGAIRGIFLTAFGLPKAVYIATAGAIGILIDSTRIITYFNNGATLPKELWYGLFLFIPISFVGAQIAKKLVDKMPEEKFRVVVSIFLFIVGVKLILFP